MAIAESIYAASRTTLALVKTWLGEDDKVNDEVIHDATKDIDADKWNKKVKGLAEVAMRTRKGNLCAYGFSNANVAAGLTDSVIARDGANDVARTEVVALFDGSLVGLTVWVENARTAGTLTIKWTKNGATQTMTVVIDGTNTQFNRAFQLPGTETFLAKERLGIAITTDGAWAAGGTPSVGVDLHVSYGEEEAV